MKRRFQNRLVLIIGATGGLGATSATRFAAEGATLALVARKPDLLADQAIHLGAGTCGAPRACACGIRTDRRGDQRRRLRCTWFTRQEKSL
ncbi:MAG: SDR family NAD(P)-dependent oxidoreductase [Oscillochloris sp.]|nr:SDR family NAD(P)-dependent oxidoreductase [Oscillochloris sp.]